MKIDLAFRVDGQAVLPGELIDTVINQMRRCIKEEMQEFLTVRRVEPAELPDGREFGAQRLAVSVGEAAHLLGLSPYSIRRYIALKRIRVIRAGRRVLVPMSSIDTIMKMGLRQGHERDTT